MKSERHIVWMLIVILGLSLLGLVLRHDELNRELKRLDSSVARLESANLEHARSEAMKAKQKALVYFPDGAFDADPVRDSVLADRYARPLRELGLVSFLERARLGQDSQPNGILDPQFRLIVSSSSGISSAVLVGRELIRYRPAPTGATHLVARVEPSFRPQTPLPPMAFSKEQAEQFHQLLKGVDFWSMAGAAKTGGPTFEPSRERILLEAIDGDRYHVVVRDADAPAEWFALCELIRRVAENRR